MPPSWPGGSSTPTSSGTAPTRPANYLNPQLQGMEYDSGPEAEALVAAWEQGRTGFPIVDAGMRQLLGEAYVHNRVRMIVASFLVKDLHQEWTRGARYFLRHLVDGDLASNNHGWQWVAGTGTDASPYYRVFNPVTQGKKFDPDGAYVKRWVPELRGLDPKHVHEPWTAPGGVPAGYPEPIVDHAHERLVSLDRYNRVRSPLTPGKGSFAYGVALSTWAKLPLPDAGSAGQASSSRTFAVAPGSCRAWSATAAATAWVTSGSNTLGMM